MRKFLVVLDDSRECLNAMRFAAMRAAQTGGGVHRPVDHPARRVQPLDRRRRHHARRGARADRGAFRGLRQVDARPAEGRSRTS